MTEVNSECPACRGQFYCGVEAGESECWCFAEDPIDPSLPKDCLCRSHLRDEILVPERLLVTGSRSWADEEKIRGVLEKLPAGSRVIHGGARGADRLAGKVAIELGFDVQVFYADWSKGRGAGLLRNKQMLKEGFPTRVVAFWDGVSRGTAHMIEEATKAGFVVELVQ